MKKILLILLLPIGLFTNAQEITKVENAVGRQVIAGSISEEEYVNRQSCRESGKISM